MRKQLKHYYKSPKINRNKKILLRKQNEKPHESRIRFTCVKTERLKRQTQLQDHVEVEHQHRNLN